MCWRSECARLLSLFPWWGSAKRIGDLPPQTRGCLHKNTLRDGMKTDADTRFDSRGRRNHFPASEWRGDEQSLAKPSLSSRQVSITDTTSALAELDGSTLLMLLQCLETAARAIARLAPRTVRRHECPRQRLDTRRCRVRYESHGEHAGASQRRAQVVLSRRSRPFGALGLQTSGLTSC